MPSGRPKKGEEITLKKAIDFFNRLKDLIMGDKNLFFIEGALIEMSQEDDKIYYKNYPTNLINKFKDSDSKEERQAASDMSYIYEFCKMVVGHRLASDATKVDSNTYAGMAMFVLKNNHGWSDGRERNTSINVAGSGKVEIKSEGEEPEVS